MDIGDGVLSVIVLDGEITWMCKGEITIRQWLDITSKIQEEIIKIGRIHGKDSVLGMPKFNPRKLI